MTSVSLAVGVGLGCRCCPRSELNLAFLSSTGARSPLPTSNAPSAAERDRSLPLQVVELRLARGGGGLRAPRGRAHACSDLDRPAVLAAGLVFLAVLAERFFGFDLGRRQWIGSAWSRLAELADADRRERRRGHAGYSLTGMIVFESIAVGVGLLLVCSIGSSASRYSAACCSGLPPGSGSGSRRGDKALSGTWTAGRPGSSAPGASSSSRPRSSRSSPPLAASRSATASR